MDGEAVIAAADDGAVASEGVVEPVDVVEYDIDGMDARAQRIRVVRVVRDHDPGGRSCLRTFLMKVWVHFPWVASCSTISSVSLVFVPLER